MYKQIFIFIFVLYPLMVAIASESQNDLHIRSDKMRVLIDRNKAEFLGNVVMTQKDFMITSDNAVLIFKKQRIKSAIFLNNVTMRTKDNNVKADKGEYSKDTSVIKLSGRVFLLGHKGNISGDVLTYNLITKQLKILGSTNGQKNNINKNRVMANFDMSN